MSVRPRIRTAAERCGFSGVTDWAEVDALDLDERRGEGSGGFEDDQLTGGFDHFPKTNPVVWGFHVNLQGTI